MASAPVAGAARLVGEGGLVILSPHPDDETIGCSTFIREAGRSRRPLGIVAMTDGEGSHRSSRTFDAKRLGAIRAREQEAAVRALGCDHARYLRLALPDGASGRSAGFSTAIDEVAAFCVELGATALAAPHPDDPHPDHHAAAAMASALRGRMPRLRIIFYEVWIRRLDAEDGWREDALTPFRLRTDPRAKRTAIDEHASQLGRVVDDDPDGFALPAWFIDDACGPFEPCSWLALPGTGPGAEHFAELYAEGGDPWHVRSSAYELEKREAAVNLLGERRYPRMLEAGCGEGHLTAALLQAGITAQAIGFDREPLIVDRANAMGWGSSARFVTGTMPDAMPAGGYDLIVFSEVLYFLGEAELTQLAAQVRDLLNPGGSVLAVCYRGRTDTPLSGRDALDFFAAALGDEFVTEAVHETRDYRMELLELRPAPDAGPESVAEDRKGATSSGGDAG
ncbi:bifunctional PIG-L family deacetylase/class I SAM-dependent methyltransferase [Aureimonas mangrovi]|uniref:bifunctional PIG-L family deacetylase/class I SAM-dependent methyltransferase n=1 Tax=Aureimonas mangrovi TaxID=2758041 RepID=UPI00163DD230|nr:bifunctional PIG-L family deacetylase/class I SAM-dependent methyltransferase [Aureimonas mangrovi]